MIDLTTWEQFKDQVQRGGFALRDLLGMDRWETWTPVRTRWTDVGTPTVTGRWHSIVRETKIQVKVVPGTTVATTAGTSYIALPRPAVGLCGDGSMMNITTLIGVGDCAIDVTNSRIYVPAQLATGNTLTIAAWYES